MWLNWRLLETVMKVEKGWSRSRSRSRSWNDRMMLEGYVLMLDWWVLWSGDMSGAAMGLNRRRCHTVLKLVVHHVIWESLSLHLCSTFPRVLCLLDFVRHLDHQVCIFQMRVFSPDFGHGLVSGFLDLLLVTVFHIFVQRATATSDLAKVLIGRHVLRADITRRLLAEEGM